MKKNKNITQKNVWHDKTADYALEKIGATKDGLSSAKASERLKQNGPNILPQKKTNICFYVVFWRAN